MVELLEEEAKEFQPAVMKKVHALRGVEDTTMPFRGVYADLQ